MGGAENTCDEYDREMCVFTTRGLTMTRRGDLFRAAGRSALTRRAGGPASRGLGEHRGRSPLGRSPGVQRASPPYVAPAACASGNTCLDRPVCVGRKVGPETGPGMDLAVGAVVVGPHEVCRARPPTVPPPRQTERRTRDKWKRRRRFCPGGRGEICLSQRGPRNLHFERDSQDKSGTAACNNRQTKHQDRERLLTLGLTPPNAPK